MRSFLGLASPSALLSIALSLSLAAGACSASSGEGEPQAPRGGAAGAENGGAGLFAGAGGSGGGTSGAAGSSSSTGGGGSSGGGAAGTGGATGGSGGASGGSAGSDGTADCTPNPAGTFMPSDQVVFDPKTCLTWMRSNTSGDPYAAADAYCAALSLGGYEDWRLPTAGEVVSIFKCDGTYPPVVDVFQVMGDGIWTTTLSGTIAGDEPKVCGAGQASGQFYDFGKVGGQNTRCVRGPMTLPDRPDCKTNTSICGN